jgi:hypothetical protein
MIKQTPTHRGYAINPITRFPVIFFWGEPSEGRKSFLWFFGDNKATYTNDAFITEKTIKGKDEISKLLSKVDGVLL